MFCSITCVNMDSGPCFLVLILISSSAILFYGAEAAEGYKVMNIGAIIDVNSRIGKEQKVAMEIAAQNFNNVHKNYKLSLHFQYPERDPLRVGYAAEALIKEKEVKVIIGMETWGEATVVADIGSRAQVPVLSFAEPAIPPPLTSTRWPFLVRVADSSAERVKCTAALVGSYNWRRVIVIYEDDANSVDNGNLSLLSENLQSSGSEIEYRLVLPPFSYLTNPKQVVEEELEKLLRTESRVFIILQLSLPMAIHLFREAKEIGLVGADSVWIITAATVTGFVDSFNTSVISSMEGALGIKTYFSQDSSSYKNFEAQFRNYFLSEYPEEDISDPGIYALRAYDSIKIVTQSMDRMTIGDNSSSKILLDNMLSSNFTGVSGQISFEGGKLLNTPTLRIINMIGKKYKEVDFWLPEFGFSKTLVTENEKNSSKVGDITTGFAGTVIWPGDLKRDPRGRAMPTDAKPLIVGVPARTTFNKFVRVIYSDTPHKIKYDGYCIELFYKLLQVLEYALPYEFVVHYGTYDDMLYNVYNKTWGNFLQNYDAVIGDVTILVNRTKTVEFTQPYTESGLSMLVPAKSEKSTWMFIKPFTCGMWMVTGVILIYTMSIVWFLEHRWNPEFNGAWNDQIGTALWFTFSSLFFAHRERIHNNLTRLVVVVWLFVVLILTSSYTASLSSMLTVQRLKPNVTDIEWLKTTNLKVGFDGDAFVRNYLVNVLGFKPENILRVHSEHEYAREFRSKRIVAAFLELPYEKAFLSKYCKEYTASRPTYRFGGFGFVFQKGSPIAADFSEAILKLSENGELKSLEDKWFTPSPECSGSDNANDNKSESLSLQNFWGLYLISGTTSTICVVLFLVKNYRQHRNANEGSRTLSGRSFWKLRNGFAKYIYNRRESMTPGVDECSSSRRESGSPFETRNNLQESSESDNRRERETTGVDKCSSSRRESGSPIETPNNLQESSESDTEMQYIPGCI